MLFTEAAHSTRASTSGPSAGIVVGSFYLLRHILYSVTLLDRLVSSDRRVHFQRDLSWQQADGNGRANPLCQFPILATLDPRPLTVAPSWEYQHSFRRCQDPSQSAITSTRSSRRGTLSSPDTTLLDSEPDKSRLHPFTSAKQGLPRGGIAGPRHRVRSDPSRRANAPADNCSATLGPAYDFVTAITHFSSWQQPQDSALKELKLPLSPPPV